MGQKALEIGNETESRGNQEAASQLKSDNGSGVNSIQKVADQSKDVSQLKEFDTLANKRDRDGLHQLQKKANTSSESRGLLQAFGLNAEKAEYSQSQDGSHNTMENQDEISLETNEI